MISATCILILGMHRSGTSCLAGSLQQHGLYLGKVFESNPHNRKGNRENAEIMELNNSVLAYNHARWDKPLESIIWSKEHEETRDQIIDGFIKSGYPMWGFKDPRTLFTLPFWLEGLSKTNIRFVGTFRQPVATVYSLRRRDNMPVEMGFALWEIYNAQLLRFQKTYQFPLIPYDLAANEYQRSIHRVLLTLDLPLNPEVKEPFFDKYLRHESADNELQIPGRVLELYEKFMNICKGQEL